MRSVAADVAAVAALATLHSAPDSSQEWDSAGRSVCRGGEI